MNAWSRPHLLRARAWIGVLAGASLLGCGGEGASGDAAAGAGEGDATSAADASADSDETAATEDAAAAVDAVDPFDGAPPQICRQGAAWDGKSALFEEATDAYGLGDDSRVLGVRVSSADLDGDFFPDVVVRRNVIGKRSDPSDPAQRFVTVLRNVAKAGDRALQDVTVASGLLTTRDGAQGRPCHVAVFGDVDNDGDVDVFCGMNVTQDAQGDAVDTSEWLRNDGKGSFALVGEASPFGGDARRSLTSATFVDHDRDGDLDLWLGYNTWGSASTADLLFAGDAKGAFANVSKAEGLSTLTPTLSNLQSGKGHRNTWGTGACDFNGDGHPDLYSTSYGRYFNGLWLGGAIEGGSRYVDAMFDSGFSRDDDDDWRSNWNAQCYCFDNPKAAECDTCGPPVVNCPSLKQSLGGVYRWNHATDREPWRLGGTTAGMVCADLDRDGDLDTVQWSIVHSDVGASSDPSHVMRNDGGLMPLFTHIKPTTNGLQRDWGNTGWNEGDLSGAVADLDLDGRLDILVASSDYPGTRMFVWLQKADGTFSEVPFALAIDQTRATGLAVVDLDRDGDLDVVLGSSRSRCSGASGADCPPDERVRIWRNRTIEPGDGGVGVSGRGNAITIALRGKGGPGGANASAIGARVEVVAGGVTQTFELQGGYGHFGQQNDLVVHAGLGATCAIDEVRVRWPNTGGADGKGTVQTFPHVRANQFVLLREGDAEVQYPLWTP